jgi:hypothetical protein
MIDDTDINVSTILTIKQDAIDKFDTIYLMKNEKGNEYIYIKDRYHLYLYAKTKEG